jgi:hypothetical protein
MKVPQSKKYLKETVRGKKTGKKKKNDKNHNISLHRKKV